MSAIATRTVALACTACVSFMGLDFHPAPALIAVTSSFLVRVPLFRPRRRKLAEASFTLLGMLGAFVTVVDAEMGAGRAFWAGIAFGAIASSMLEIGKSATFGAMQTRFQAAANALLGLNGGKP
jgi:hypothetical protein